MTFEITVLGSNSAIPAHSRHPSAQVVNIHHHLFLVDCGEGTQIQMAKYHIKRNRINHVFITHLHGDHFYGLIGLLTTFNLTRRPDPLHVYGPAGLEEIINIQLRYSEITLCYPVYFHQLNPTGFNLIYENNLVEVYSFPLIHRIPCTGFLFKEKRVKRHIRPEAIEKYGIPLEMIEQIKNGADFVTSDGTMVPNDALTIPSQPPRKYAYCTDTIYTESIIPYIQHVDLLYHEATFDRQLTDRAKNTFHSTTEQAARIALKAGVKRLLIGHYSAKYATLEPLLEEAKAVFPATELAIEGKTYSIVRLPREILK